MLFRSPISRVGPAPLIPPRRQPRWYVKRREPASAVKFRRGWRGWGGEAAGSRYCRIARCCWDVIPAGTSLLPMPTKWAGQRRCRQCLAMVARLSAVAAVFRRDASRTRCRTLIPPFPGVTRPAVLSALTAGRLGNGAAPGSRTRLRLDVGRYTRTYLTIDTAAPRRGDPWACLSYERFTRAAKWQLVTRSASGGGLPCRNPAGRVSVGMQPSPLFPDLKGPQVGPCIVRLAIVFVVPCGPLLVGLHVLWGYSHNDSAGSYEPSD